MKRTLLFLVLLLLFIAWRFPHRSVVEAIVVPPLARAGIAASIDDVSYRPLLRYRLTGVELRRDETALSLADVTMGLGLGGSMSLDADACDGRIRGSLVSADNATGDRGRDLQLTFDRVDPSTCLEAPGLTLRGRFSGVLDLQGVGQAANGRLLGALAGSGELRLEGENGSIGGTLPATGGARSGAAGIPLGEWDVRKLDVEARLAKAGLTVTHAQIYAEGIEWTFGTAKLTASPSGEVRISAELRARTVEETPRSKAILGMLPRAGTGNDGVRRYRISGTLSAPKLVGLK
jgi:type II secretion system protein N